MMWDYAELSKAAKAAGGPEELVNRIERQAKAVGRTEGKASMAPWLGVVAIGVSLVTATVIKIVDHFNEKKKISQSNVDQSKAELVQGIQEYDEMHPKRKTNENSKQEFIPANKTERGLINED